MKKRITLCDICGKSIDNKHFYGRDFKVTIKEAEPDWPYRSLRKLDLCTNCMGKFKEFVRGQDGK